MSSFVVFDKVDQEILDLLVDKIRTDRLKSQSQFFWSYAGDQSYMVPCIFQNY